MPAYQPYGAVAEVWACKAPEVLIPGPAGTGKTRGILEKVMVAACKYPGARVLLVRKTRASMTESVLVTWEAHVAVNDDGKPLSWVGNLQRSTRRSYDLPNGSSVVVAGMDNVDRILSTEYDLICCFEATELTENDFETLTTRLRNGRMPYQQIIADCNPTHPGHFLKRRADAGRMANFPSSHKDNPRLWDGEKWTREGDTYIARLGNLTGHRRERLLLGRWAAAEGLVYPEWDESTHVVDTMPEGWHDWPKYRAIDFGYTNPFVCQWWAADPDGRLYLYREIYRTQRTVADHARDIIRLSGDERYTATIADHDAEDRATLLSAGIHSIPANKAVSVGIQRMSERIRLDHGGRPRMFALRTALVESDPLLIEAKRPYSTLQEFDCYLWAKGSDGKPNKEEPVKEHDHGMDCARYMVAHLDAPGVSSMGAYAGNTKLPDRAMLETVGAGGSAGAWGGSSRWDRGWTKMV